MRRLLSALTIVAVSCSPAPRARTLAIVNGEADWPEELPGVVRLERGGRTCSGTIVGTDGSTAWALTAAHCGIDPYDLVYVGRPVETVRIGPVLADSTTLPVGRMTVHPRYDLDRHEITGNVDPWPIGSSWDFALVEVPDAAPLVESFAIAPMTSVEDDVAPGTPLRVGGWGISVWPDVTPGVRQRGATSVDEIVPTARTAADLLIVDESGGAAGPCFGDSGGPAVVDGPDGPRVAGVASGNVTVVAPCADKATYARVSQAEDFVAAVLAGEAIEPASCASCAVHASAPAGACEATGATVNGGSVGALLDCLRRASWSDCASGDPAAAGALQDHYDCLSAACAQCPPGVATLARCGIDYDGLGPCADCLLAAGDCCALTSRCQHEGACSRCLNRTDMPDGCADDPLFLETIACVRGACDDSCGRFLSYAPGTQADAGPDDAGTPDAAAPDGGAADAGEMDAGPDAGGPPWDSGAEDDAGTAAPPRDDEGCGCHAPGRAAPHGALGLALLAGWIHRRQRRRRQA